MGIGAGVVGYDVLCPPGETLSEAVDRALETKTGKVLALGGIAVTAAHLANVLPERVDPIHYALKWKRVKEIIEEAL